MDTARIGSPSDTAGAPASNEQVHNRRRWWLAAAFELRLAGALLAHGQSGSAQSGYLFDNFNGAAVQNATQNFPVINLSQDSFISTIATYHWNNGQGAHGPVTLTLTRTGGTWMQKIGDFPAAGQAGQGGVANADEVATVNQTVPAGTYIVYDSEQSTWSSNAASGFTGFTRVSGYLTGVVTPPPGPQGPAAAAAPAPAGAPAPVAQPAPAPVVQPAPRPVPALPGPGAQPGCGPGAVPLPVFEPNQAPNLFFPAYENPCDFGIVQSFCNFYGLRAVVVRGEFSYPGPYPQILVGCVQ